MFPCGMSRNSTCSPITTIWYNSNNKSDWWGDDGDFWGKKLFAISLCCHHFNPLLFYFYDVGQTFWSLNALHSLISILQHCRELSFCIYFENQHLILQKKIFYQRIFWMDFWRVHFAGGLKWGLKIIIEKVK